MVKKLIKINPPEHTKVTALTTKARRQLPFRMLLEVQLDRHFSFKQLKTQDSRQFDLFLNKTIGRGLTITETETLFLRTTGPHGAKHVEQHNSVMQDVIHFSNGTRDFRIHGYYNYLGYFVLVRIDPHHQYKF